MRTFRCGEGFGVNDAPEDTTRAWDQRMGLWIFLTVAVNCWVYLIDRQSPMLRYHEGAAIVARAPSHFLRACLLSRWRVSMRTNAHRVGNLTNPFPAICSIKRKCPAPTLAECWNPLSFN